MSRTKPDKDGNSYCTVCGMLLSWLVEDPDIEGEERRSIFDHRCKESEAKT